MSYRGGVLVTSWYGLSCVNPPTTTRYAVKGPGPSCELFLRQTALGASEDAVSADGWRRAGHDPPDQQGGCLQFPLSTKISVVLLTQCGGPLACTILIQLGGPGLSWSLFLIDLKQLNTRKLPGFYHGLLKVWSLLKKERLGHHSSVYWLLQKPVLYGTRFCAVCQVGPPV